MNFSGFLELTADIGLDTTILLGDSLGITPILNFIPDSVYWLGLSRPCISCFRPRLLPLRDLIVEFVAIDSNGCEVRAQRRIKVDRNRNVYAPNVFSPNGDGINDLFYLQADARRVKVVELKMFSRWGELVYSAQNIPVNSPTFSWDGSYKGKMLGSTVYFWQAIVEYRDGVQDMISGDLALIH